MYVAPVEVVEAHVGAFDALVIGQVVEEAFQADPLWRRNRLPAFTSATPALRNTCAVTRTPDIAQKIM
jgi:hypothetical protein